MREFQATSANGFMAVGQPFALKMASETIREAKTTDKKIERKRFDNAIKTADKELAILEERASHVDDEQSRLFQAHRLMLKDPELLKPIREKIAEGVSAEPALEAVSQRFLRRFEKTDDMLLKTRKDDILDVVNRLLRVLRGSFHVRELPEGKHIVLAKEIYPSDVFTLGRNKIAGIVLQNGSIHSHVALLADALEIPFFVGLDDDYDDLAESETLVLDGKSQVIIADPDTSTLKQYKKHVSAISGTTVRPEDISAVTKSGIRVRVSANISSPEEAKEAVFRRADGIGLFRTEYVSLASDDLPDEEHQFLIYKNVMDQFRGKPVTIRTMDLGSDKNTASSNHAINNPALGIRGIRHSRTHEGMFKTQLRALIRASKHGRLKIMVPMIISEDEIHYVKELLKDLEADLSGGRTHMDFPYKFGIMVETPAAALMAEEFADHVDFFSIGTNDLTQYTLAADRLNPDVAKIYDHRHPAVIRLIETIMEAAGKKNIPVSICGEAAADPDMLDQFIRLGIDELSVAVNRITGLKEGIHEHE